MDNTECTKHGSDNIGNFTTVDHAQQPRWFIDFMDMANSIPEYDKINRSLATALGNMEGKSVLDLGSGTGDDARQLAGLLKNVSQVIGVDISDSMLEEARKRSLNSTGTVSFTKGDGENLPFVKNYFDGARAKLVLSHCDNVDATLDELIRVVRPQGPIAIYEYDFDTMTIDHDNKKVTREVIRRYSDAHRNNWVGRALFAKYKSRGMQEIVVEPHTVILPFHFLGQLVSGLLSYPSKNKKDELISEKEIKQWWDEIREKYEAGTFFSSFAGFLVSGRTPK